MTSLTIELPDDTCRRLRDLAAARGISLDALIEELGSAALAARDAKSRFRTFASEGSSLKAMAILDRLDRPDHSGLAATPPI